jgi:hypothetical protein
MVRRTAYLDNSWKARGVQREKRARAVFDIGVFDIECFNRDGRAPLYRTSRIPRADFRRRCHAAPRGLHKSGTSRWWDIRATSSRTRLITCLCTGQAPFQPFQARSRSMSWAQSRYPCTARGLPTFLSSNALVEKLDNRIVIRHNYIFVAATPPSEPGVSIFLDRADSRTRPVSKFETNVQYSREKYMCPRVHVVNLQ